MGGIVRVLGATRARLRAAGAMALLAVLVTGGFAACTPSGPDQEVWNGGGQFGPSGYLRVQFKSIGTEPLVGRTTVTADVDAGPLRFTSAAYFPVAPPGAGDSLTGSGLQISPDGKHLTYYLDGTTPTDNREVRIYYTGEAPLPPASSWHVTFTHSADVNAANNTIAVGPPPPVTTTTAP
jgi:hypothetical protein